MKALIIENEYEVDGYIQAFLKDNPKLFESVQEELYCLHRGKEELLPHVLANDAIVVASTWMYKDQLEEFLEAFTNPKFPKKLKFFAHWITRTANEWKHGWTQDKDLFSYIRKLLEIGHELYDFGEDHESKVEIVDNLGVASVLGGKEYSRAPFTYYQVKYSKSADLFYSKDKWCTLKQVKEDEQEKLRRNSGR